MTQYNEAPLVATLKSSKDYDAAWLVLRADNPVEMQSMLDALTNNGFGAVLGKADAAFKAEFIAGKGLGATPIEAPQNPAPAPQADNPWAASQPQNPAPQQSQDPWGGYGQQQAAPQAQAPAPQQAGTFGGGDEAPFLPGIGMQAKIVTGTSKKTGKPWRAAADPRSQQQTAHIQERTDDPNHPGLAAGTHTFWKFLRD